MKDHKRWRGAASIATYTSLITPAHIAAYMAPEVATEGCKYDGQIADIWYVFVLGIPGAYTPMSYKPMSFF